MEYEVEGFRSRGRRGEIWGEVVQKGCKLNRDDAINYSRWRKLIKDGG